MVDEETLMSGIEILLSEHHGIYIPKKFSEDFGGWGIPHEDVVELS